MTPPRDDELERLEEDETLPDRDSDANWDDIIADLDQD